MQQLWLCKVGWDEPVQDDLLKDWLEIASDLKTVSELSVRRCYFSTVVDQSELHSFADASMKAYGAVVFLTQGNEVSFIMAKSSLETTDPPTFGTYGSIGCNTLNTVCDGQYFTSKYSHCCLVRQSDCAASDKESETTSSICPQPYSRDEITITNC